MEVLTPLLLMVSTAVRLVTRVVSHRLAMWDCTLMELVRYNKEILYSVSNYSVVRSDNVV